MEFKIGDQVRIKDDNADGANVKAGDIGKVLLCRRLTIDVAVRGLVRTFLKGSIEHIKDSQLPMGAQMTLNISCQCGSALLGSDRHSDWCPIK